jgi:hypothetical protein
MNDISTALEFLTTREWACLGQHGMAELLVDYAQYASREQRPFKVPFMKVVRTVPMPPEVRVDTKVIDGMATMVVTINTKATWYEDMEILIAEGERILAIKLLRNNTGMGLRESKEFLDKWYPEGGIDGVVTVIGKRR